MKESDGKLNQVKLIRQAKRKKKKNYGNNTNSIGKLTTIG